MIDSDDEEDYNPFRDPPRRASDIGLGSPVAAGKRLEDLALERARRQYDIEDPSKPEWALHKKHVFVLSSAGKPIFSRYGDESQLAPQMGLLQALVSFVDDRGDTIRYIRAGKVNIVFVLRGALYLVAVSSTGETVEHLWRQLGLLHSQIISILTSKVNQIFQRNASFDARGLLGGTDRVMRSLLHAAGADPAMLLQAVPCLRMPPPIRAELTKILSQVKQADNDLLFALMISHNHLVTLLRPKRNSLHPDDVLLIMNTVASSASFREDEAWLPICLPRFNDAGFLYAHISFVFPELCLVLLTPKPTASPPRPNAGMPSRSAAPPPPPEPSEGEAAAAARRRRPTPTRSARAARVPRGAPVRHRRAWRPRGAPLPLPAARRRRRREWRRRRWARRLHRAADG